MKNLLRMTDAAVLAIHALALLASADGPVQAARIAAAMGASDAHLSKVLQRLARIGLVSSVRGPKGGFSLAREPESVNLLEVFEAVDGPLGEESCLLGHPACHEPGECPVRQLADDVRALVVARLGGLTLLDVDLADLLD